MGEHQPARYHKKEILKICSECAAMDGPTCIIADIEASKDEYLILPTCLKNRNTPAKTGTPHDKNRNTQGKNRNTPDPKQRKIVSGDGCSDSLIPMTKTGTHCSEKTGTPQYVQTGTGKLKLTDIDKKILELLADMSHQRKIAKELKIPLTTINRRIKRMEKARLITSTVGVYNTKIYKISSNLTSNLHTPEDSLIHNEDKPNDAVFTAHSMSFKFPILKGKQPRSPKGYKTKTWTGFVFNHPDYTIRSTPKNILIDINLDLGAHTIDELNLRYSQLAQSYAYKFAQKYHIVLGGISKSRQAHFTIEDNALAQIISERGEFRTTSGLMIDKSKSSGDLEMPEDAARAMEFTLTKLPAMAEGIRKDTRTIQTRLNEISTGIEDLQKWVILERENRQLHTHNIELERALERLSDEIQEIKNHIENPEDNLKPGEMYG